ncbi:MAG: ABC transporter permease subunit [Pseudomonadota bacterium]
MANYLIKRLLLIIPTIFGLILITFVLVQFAPGGPVERVLAELSGNDVSATQSISGGGGDGIATRDQQSSPAATGGAGSKYIGSQGLDPKFIAEIEKEFGFDKPPVERFFLLLGNYTCINYLREQFFQSFSKAGERVPGCPEFGKSYFKGRPVVDLIIEKLPVSISLGLWMTLISYLVSIPLGIRKAVHYGEPFDTWTSGALVLGYAIPGFLFAVLLMVLFASSSFLQIFPNRGLFSENWNELSTLGKIGDYFWHLTLPLISIAVGAFTTTAFLTKNSFIDEIRKQYVMTARAKGLTENQVLYGHVFRNAMLLIIAGFPAAFIGAFFAGSLLIEQIFSLDGLGLLGFKAIIDRDYPIVFGTLFIFGLLGMVVNLLSDFIYTLVDPRIDFESREV